MVIKGSSRSNPRQLARHLLRRDQNTTVEILQCDSSPRADLREALEDMQLLAQGTLGTKGLYHAQINPDAKYTLTPEQWRLAADVLEKELGLVNQPRAVVYHEKDGRPHIHVVWQRTHIDSMTLVSDSQNYRAHERASLELEREFGHDHIPGRHAKRDPDKERPTAAFNHAAWQQFERTGLDPRRRKAEITALFHQAETGVALRQALREAGYQLARGDRRSLVVLDPAAEIHSLARQIDGVRARDVRQKLADLESADLPPATALQVQLRDRPTRVAPVPDAQLPSAAAEAHARLDTARRTLLKRLRDERLEREAAWSSTVAEGREAFERTLSYRRRAEREQDIHPRTPRGFLAPLRAAWERFKDRLDPARIEARHRATELREEARDQRDQQERRQHAERLDEWLAAQRLNLRRHQREQRRTFEAERAQELERLERDAALIRETPARAQQDRERSRPGPGRDDR
ncbi:MAG: relaxase/mobilization nuclease domain-containing protein [Myxococcota bacterium]